MAEFIISSLEKSLPDLDILIKKTVISQAEGKSIISKRKKFEYATRRPSPLKYDFMSYIAYESRLHSLVQMRLKRMAIQEGKQSLIYLMVKRVFYLYERVCSIFIEDVSLWERYISFAKQTGKTRHVSNVYARALQAHPTASVLWSSAASWEIKTNQNWPAARVLYQQGLRFNKDTPSLWLSFLEMELQYAQMLQQRMEILNGKIAPDSFKIHGDDEVPKEGVAKEEENEVITSQDSQDMSGLDKTQTSTSEVKPDVKNILDGALAVIIFNAARNALQDDPSFIQQSAKIITGYENATICKAEIYKYIE